MSIFSKKHIWGALSCLAVLAALLPQTTFASWFSIGDITGRAIGFMVFIFVYIFMFLAGLLVYVMTGAIGMLLDVSSNIATTPAVRIGFPISLAVANLGLLLSLIVIGVMTVLRSNSYGAKNTLWKVVVMALAINFGLVIAQGILDFSNTGSRYFLSAVDNAGGQGNSYNFASALGGAFRPQQLFMQGNSEANFGEETTAGSKVFAGIVRPIAMGAIATLSMFAILATLGALMLALLYRYVELILLMILLPLAWAAWVLPSTSKYWQQWWDRFINQVVFAPVVLFFLYLTIRISSEIFNSKYDLSMGMSYGDGEVSSFATGMLKQIITTSGQVWVLVGISLGGLFVAKSMGMKFSDGAMGMVNKQWGAIGGFVKARAQRTLVNKTVNNRMLGNMIMPKDRKKDGNSYTLGQALQERTADAQKTKLGAAITKGTPLAYGVKKLAEAGIADQEQYKKTISEVDKWDSGKAKRELLTAMGEKREAILMKLVKEGEASEEQINEVLTENFESKWKDRGQGKAYTESVVHVRLENPKMNRSQRGTAGSEYYEKQRETIEKMDKDAVKRISLAHFLGEEDKATKTRKSVDKEHLAHTLKNIVEADQQDVFVPTLLGKMNNARDRAYFTKEFEATVRNVHGLDPAKRDEILGRFKKHLGNIGVSYGGGSTPSTPPAAPPAAGGTP